MIDFDFDFQKSSMKVESSSLYLIKPIFENVRHNFGMVVFWSVYKALLPTRL